MSEEASIETRLARHLEAELGDAGTARRFAALLVEEALTWRAPVLPLGRIRTIIGFTFGNRMHANGNREPGPVNAALADLAVDLRARTGARIWAQWEIAEAIGTDAPDEAVVAIYPGRDEKGEPRYLSTGGVIEAIVARADGAGALGPVAVVAVRDHAARCVALCRRHGLEAGVAEGLPLPELYDPASGQGWTRDRLTYLLHDLHCRAIDRRDDLIAAAERAGGA